MENEVEALSNALDHPQRPLVAIVGGSKISTKLDLLKNLTAKVDVLVPGGGMANTFLAAGGVKVGASLCEYDMLDTAKEIMAGSIKQGCQIILPQDVAIAPHFATQAAREIVDVTAIPGKMMALDVGPKSVAAINDVLETAKTIVWNGPLGAFELSPFEQGTKAVAQTIARLTADGKVLSVAGGGDTVAAVNMAGVASNLTYVSTAGGAFLEWLEGRVLPGVEILRKEKTPSKVVM
jgi:phosphoglycerate kinase